MSESSTTPAFLHLTKFTAARVREMQLMLKCLSTNSGTKMAFQKLPKHMRRRAMSHNVKRLPQRVRQIHLSQMTKSGLPPKQKKPSRKYRRRPFNLVKEYERRRLRVKWLSTHIWHAKRFHMIEEWGWKLPERPCDKAFRACFRATTKHCLLQDISYYNCVELQGTYELIVDKFKLITCSSNGLSIGAAAFKNCNREGSIFLYNLTTKTPIGKIMFLWGQEQQKLWLWIHAAFYEETLETLLELFKETGVKLEELHSQIQRLRLVGPLSQSTLLCLFRPLENTTNWTSFTEITSCNTLSPGQVLSLTVEDPRYNFPKKRLKPAGLVEDSPIYNEVIFETNSLLWDSLQRQQINEFKQSNETIKELRSQNLVPGHDITEKGAEVPVILVQTPGVRSTQNNGYANGWDLILPKSYTQPFWLGLILFGARSGGLREANSILFECGQVHLLHPDTKAGQENEQKNTSKNKEQFFKLPPNKRTNFNKFNIVSPFEFNWTLLIEEWASKKFLEPFKVLRNIKLLRQLEQNQLIEEQSENTLVAVHLLLTNKGSCEEFSLICLPDIKDLIKLPEEPIKMDHNQKLRIKTRKEHKDLLKKLRLRRRRAKKKNQIIPIDKELLKTYQETMRELWLPKATEIRKTCTREVMGFVTKGGFSFLKGQACCVGYVTLTALKTLLKNKKLHNKVLVRSTNSRQYRMASLQVITNL